MKRIFNGFSALTLVVAATLLGCEAQSARESAGATEALAPAADESDAAAVVRNRATALNASKRFAENLGVGESITSTSTDLSRKIIYNAQVELVVENFTGVPDRVIALVKKYDAYVASSNLGGSSGDNRSASWTIRVPVERFEELVNATKGLGELTRVSTTSRDVSEEYYDVEARIRNKTKEEERLLKLLEERPGKLDDVIAIERELSRVRGELERMQGRMRVLTNLTSLTTVNLSVTEIRDYRPPQAPTLATRTRRSFEGSLTSLRSAGESILIGTAALTPWLPVAAVVLSPAYVVARRLRRSVRDELLRHGDR